MFQKYIHHFVAISVFTIGSGFVGAQENPAEHNRIGDQPKLEKIKLGTTKNVTQFGNVYLAGQFNEEDIKLLKSEGIDVVITLRTEGEIQWDERTALKKAGIEFVEIPFRKPETLTDDVFNKICEVLNENQNKKVMLHCGSANRVGAVWAVYRCRDCGIEWDSAIGEGKAVGLRTEAYGGKSKGIY